MANATYIVHWPGKSVASCISHAEQLTELAGVLGFSLTKTAAPEGCECVNCVNAPKEHAHEG